MNNINLKQFRGTEDYPYFTALAFNSDVMNMNYGRIFSEEEAAGFYQAVISTNLGTPHMGYFRVHLEDGTFIGMCALNVNEDRASYEVDYMILPSFWNCGYGTQVVEKLLTRIHSFSDVKPITATTDPNNHYSRKILLNKGFKSERVYAIDDGSLAESFILNY